MGVRISKRPGPSKRTESRERFPKLGYDETDWMIAPSVGGGDTIVALTVKAIRRELKEGEDARWIDRCGGG
jgi:hypothetical protein